MFVTIKYGGTRQIKDYSILIEIADEERIVNPNVLSSVLLSHIRKSCGFESITENLDLASENGEVVDLSSKGKEYAKKYLEPRNTYIVVKVVGGTILWGLSNLQTREYTYLNTNTNLICR